MKSTTTATNHEWDGPYTAWGVDSDECDCMACKPYAVYERTTKPNLSFRLLLTYYKIKCWLRL